MDNTAMEEFQQQIKNIKQFTIDYLTSITVETEYTLKVSSEDLQYINLITKEGNSNNMMMNRASKQGPPSSKTISNKKF